jgi:hypothetical protein
MKDLLIIFCVLLVVLMIICTLGGSIRPSKSESYVEVAPMYAVEPEAPNTSEEAIISTFVNSEETAQVPNGFDDDAVKMRKYRPQ